jgi:hypothetical protein
MASPRLSSNGIPISMSHFACSSCDSDAQNNQINHGGIPKRSDVETRLLIRDRLTRYLDHLFQSPTRYYVIFLCVDFRWL